MEDNIMKRLAIVVALLTPVLIMVAAPATTVDFSTVGTAQDIALPQAGALADVTVGYDCFGRDTESAAVGPDGVTGTTGGVLILNFSVPVTQLRLDYSLPDMSGPVSNGLFVILKKSGDDVADVETGAALTADPAGGTGASGGLAYQGVAFDQAFIYFPEDAPRFSVTGLAYAVTPPPGQGDADGNGHVDVEDLLFLVGAFGSFGGDAGYNAACDFNGDGSVDVYDLLILVENFDE
jgi:hypothetical protein